MTTTGLLGDPDTVADRFCAAIEGAAAGRRDVRGRATSAAEALNSYIRSQRLIRLVHADVAALLANAGIPATCVELERSLPTALTLSPKNCDVTAAPGVDARAEEVLAIGVKSLIKNVGKNIGNNFDSVVAEATAYRDAFPHQVLGHVQVVLTHQVTFTPDEHLHWAPVGPYLLAKQLERVAALLTPRQYDHVAALIIDPTQPAGGRHVPTIATLLRRGYLRPTDVQNAALHRVDAMTWSPLGHRLLATYTDRFPRARWGHPTAPAAAPSTVT